MRTNIVIDDVLLARAMRAAGTTTKRATVAAGLEALVERENGGKHADLLALFGTCPWDGDLAEERLDRDWDANW